MNTNYSGRVKITPYIGLIASSVPAIPESDIAFSLRTLFTMDLKGPARRLLSLSLALLMCATAAAAQNVSSEAQPALTAMSLTELPIEELMQVKIYSASKRQELMMEAAAAIYVITSEDIQRSGATSIPDALRLAPGIHVARIDATQKRPLTCHVLHLGTVGTGGFSLPRTTRPRRI